MPMQYDYIHPSWYPCLEIHGALGHAIIYEQRKYGLRIRPFVYPYNPRTPKQQFWRDYMAKGVSEWQAFSPELMNEYNQAAEKYRFSGLNRFLRMYLRANAQHLETFQ